MHPTDTTQVGFLDKRKETNLDRRNDGVFVRKRLTK